MPTIDDVPLSRRLRMQPRCPYKLYLGTRESRGPGSVHFLARRAGREGGAAARDVALIRGPGPPPRSRRCGRRRRPQTDRPSEQGEKSRGSSSSRSSQFVRSLSLASLPPAAAASVELPSSPVAAAAVREILEPSRVLCRRRRRRFRGSAETPLSVAANHSA